jgi:hypothetical protein
LPPESVAEPVRVTESTGRVMVMEGPAFATGTIFGESLSFLQLNMNNKKMLRRGSMYFALGITFGLRRKIIIRIFIKKQGGINESIKRI